MSIIGKLNVNGLIERKEKIKGQISAEQSVLGEIAGKIPVSGTVANGSDQLSGAIDHKGKIKGRVSADQGLLGTVGRKESLAGRIAVATTLEEKYTTFVLVDADGNEIAAVLVDEEVSITATANDIREGTTAVTSDGVIVGTKFIPTYITVEGYRQIRKGANFEIPYLYASDMYDFTKMQAIICVYNNRLASSVVADRVVIDEKIYPVLSNEVLSEVTRDAENKSIKLGLINDTDDTYLIRYFIYKEVY